MSLDSSPTERAPAICPSSFIWITFVQEKLLNETDQSLFDAIVNLILMKQLCKAMFCTVELYMTYE